MGNACSQASTASKPTPMRPQDDARKAQTGADAHPGPEIINAEKPEADPPAPPCFKPPAATGVRPPRPSVTCPEGRPKPSMAVAAIAAGISALPWGKADANFETALNIFVRRLWPSAKEAVEAMVKEMVPAKIHEALPHIVQGMVSFDRFVLGDEAPTVSQISVEETPTGLRVSLHIDLKAGLDASVSVAGLQLGIDKLDVEGHLMCEMGPLIGDLPVVGAVSVYFVDPLQLSYSFTGAADSMFMFPLRAGVRHGIDGALMSNFVAPNQVMVPLAANEGPVTHQSIGLLLPPIGVLRVRPRGAKNLTDSDWHIGRTAKCDAYLKMQLGSQCWHSGTVKGTVNPAWPVTDFSDFCIYSEEQALHVKVFDEDYTNKDDYIGCIAPMGVRQTLANSGKPLQLYRKANRIKTGAVITEGSGKGNIEFDFQWLSPSADKATTGHLVMATVGYITIPPHFAGGVLLRMTVDGKKVDSPVRFTPQAEIRQNAESAEEKLASVVLRGHEMGLSVAELAHITGLTVARVKHITTKHKSQPSCCSGCSVLSCGSCCHHGASERVLEIRIDEEPRALGNKVQADASVRVHLGTLLSIAVPGATFLVGDAEFRLFNHKHEEIAVGSMPLTEFTMRWPPPADGDGDMRTMMLKGTNGASVTVDLHLTVSGLVPGEGPPALAPPAP